MEPCCTDKARFDLSPYILTSGQRWTTGQCSAQAGWHRLSDSDVLLYCTRMLPPSFRCKPEYAPHKD